MQITNTSVNKYTYSQVSRNRRASDLKEERSSFSDAVTTAEEREKGEVLNITMVGQGEIGIGITAVLLEESTPEQPIVQIVSQKGIYNIDISKVDPRNATEMEMFALCCYMDKTGRGSGNSLGSYHTLYYSSVLAKYNGYTGKINENPPTWDQFANERMDWTKMEKFTVNVFKDTKDMKMMELVLWGNKLLNFFSDHIKKMS